MIQEVINGVLVFRPDNLTDDEYHAWRIKKVAEINFYWERVGKQRNNTSGEYRFLRKLRYWCRFIINRLL